MILAVLGYAFVCLGALAYQCEYRDASGADCVGFAVGNHEADLCKGRIDR